MFGPRSAVFSPIPPDFDDLLGRQECESTAQCMCMNSLADSGGKGLDVPSNAYKAAKTD